MGRQISRRLVTAYNRAIKLQGDAAERTVADSLAAYLRENPGATAEEARDFAFGLMQAAGDLYGNACSQAALDLQHEIAAEFGAQPPDIGGWLYEPDADSIARTAQKHAKALGGGDRDGFVRGIAEGARYYAERGANATMAETARKQAKSGGRGRRRGRRSRDVMFARVPIGMTTCDFCIMLASRGFAYLTEESAGEFDAYHPNCDCRIVPSWDKSPYVQGYDPDYYRDVWDGMNRCSIPDRKISDYCLLEENKARAFKEYLGFERGRDEAELTQKLYAASSRYEMLYRESNEYGDLLYQNAILEGRNGEKAKVKIAWIKPIEGGKMRLTTAFVDE